MPTPLNTLHITKLDEISFVEEGDNPLANIKLLKGKPPISNEAPMAENAEQDTFYPEEVVKSLQKRLAELEESSAVEKVKVETDQIIRKIAGPIKDVDLSGLLREIDRKAPDAGQQVRKVFNVLGERIQKGGLGRIGTVQPGGMSASEQFDMVVAEIRKKNPNMKANDALIAAAGERPDLYEAANQRGA